MRYLLVLLLLVSCGSVERKQTVTHKTSLPTFISADQKAKVYMLLGKEDQFSMNELEILAQKKIPEHIHPDSDEILFVTRGIGVMTFEGKAKKIKKGDFIVIPKGVKHSFSNGVKIFNAVQLYSPKGPEERFKKWNRVQ